MSHEHLHHTIIDGITLVRPTRQQVQAIAVGDLALDCFGNWRRITKIFGRGDDVNGLAFVCFYTDFGDGSEISGSLKEGEVMITVPSTRKWKRSEDYPSF